MAGSKTNRSGHRKRAKERFAKKHSNGRKHWAAEKQLDRLTVKQVKNQTRGRDGHTPVKRKILK